jgi:hypothetical protein
VKIPTHTEAPLDGVDREHLEQTLRTRGWQIIHKRLVEMLGRESDRCHCADDDVQVRRAQGAVAAIREVLALPAGILREINERQRRRG